MRSPPKYLSCQYHLLTLPSGFAILRYRDLCPNNILIKKGCKDVKYLIKDGLVLSSKISNGFYKSHVLIEDDVILLGKEYFCPFDSKTGKMIKTNKTVGIHWFNASWRNKKINIQEKLLRPVKRIIGIENFEKIKKYIR